MSLNLYIFTPEQMLFQGRVESISLPGSQGRFQVLPGHAPLLSTLTTGALTYRQNGQEHTVKVASGIAEVSEGRVRVLLGPDRARTAEG